MYNTVLGALPLQENGKNFYYSDYNFDAKRVYKEARWACCSGTLPQVAADYRINIYFRAPQAVYVNLYVPSTLHWNEDRTALELTQEGEFPYEERVSFTVTSSETKELTLYFRIPGWAQGAEVFVNGARQVGLAMPGQFAAVRRTWRTGDRVELELPLRMQLETIDAQHADMVALLRGPLVLMAAKEKQEASLAKLTRAQLLAARRVSKQQWQAESVHGAVTLLPFTWLGSRPYTTYVQVS